jgi:FixJ family two-component response regulator
MRKTTNTTNRSLFSRITRWITDPYDKVAREKAMARVNKRYAILQSRMRRAHYAVARGTWSQVAKALDALDKSHDRYTKAVNETSFYGKL